MIGVKCKNCNKKFFVKPSCLKVGNGKYCSIYCTRMGKRNGKLVNCSKCDKKVYRSLRSLNRSKTKTYFCSRKCSLYFLKEMSMGQLSSNWKGGKSSYKNIIRRSEKLTQCTLCEKDDTRILIVHHIDRNRKNNEIKNLSWLCYNCHFLVHHFPDTNKLFLSKI